MDYYPKKDDQRGDKVERLGEPTLVARIASQQWPRSTVLELFWMAQRHSACIVLHPYGYGQEFNDHDSYTNNFFYNKALYCTLHPCGQEQNHHDLYLLFCNKNTVHHCSKKNILLQPLEQGQ
jgi:hypothetical protein